jgi:hypothetical protein
LLIAGLAESSAPVSPAEHEELTALLAARRLQPLPRLLR